MNNENCLMVLFRLLVLRCLQELDNSPAPATETVEGRQLVSLTKRLLFFQERCTVMFFVFLLKSGPF